MYMAAVWVHHQRQVNILLVSLLTSLSQVGSFLWRTASLFSELNSHSGQSSLRPPSGLGRCKQDGLTAHSGPRCAQGSYASASAVAATLIVPASSKLAVPLARAVQHSTVLPHVGAPRCGWVGCICVGILGRMRKL